MALTFSAGSRGVSGSIATPAAVSGTAPTLQDSDTVHVLFDPDDHKKLGGIKIENNTGDAVYVHVEGIHPKHDCQGGDAGADPESTSAWAEVATDEQHTELNLWSWCLIPNGGSQEFVNQRDGIPGIGKVYAMAEANGGTLEWTTTVG